MNLSDLNIDVFFSCVAEVHRQPSDPDEQPRLLDAAREDTPIINGILREFMAMVALDRHRKHRKAIAIAQRDLVIFLALRAMERRGRAKEMPRLN